MATSGGWWVVAPASGGVNGAGDFAQQAANPPANAVAGPYKTKAEADAAIAEIKKTGTAPNLLSAATEAAGTLNPLTGLAAIGDFFQRLTQGSTWIRVGEVVLGLILVAVGVARITHAVPAATAVAKTVGAVAV